MDLCQGMGWYQNHDGSGELLMKREEVEKGSMVRVDMWSLEFPPRRRSCASGSWCEYLSRPSFFSSYVACSSPILSICDGEHAEDSSGVYGRWGEYVDLPKGEGYVTKRRHR